MRGLSRCTTDHIIVPGPNKTLCAYTVTTVTLGMSCMSMARKNAAASLPALSKRAKLQVPALRTTALTLQVPLVEQQAWEGLSDPLPKIKQAAEQDRNIMEKGTRAFVSYVRGYREHQVDHAVLFRKS